MAQVIYLMLYRAVSAQELVDIIGRGGFHPGPPSFQGKWFAETPQHAAQWGKRLHLLGGAPFHLVEVEVAQAVAGQFFRLPNLDGIGPARFVEVHQLGLLNSATRKIQEINHNSPGRSVMLHPVAHTQLRWLAPSEGGRQELPSGPSFAATARFADDPDERLFSVVLHFIHPTADQQRIGEADLCLVFPERLPEVRPRLVPGSRLVITEGLRAVAECNILSLVKEPVTAADKGRMTNSE